MTLNRVVYDQNLVVLALHPMEQALDLSAYERDGRTVSTLVADSADVPGVMIDEREDVRDENGNPVLDANGRQLLGRVVNMRPRVLSQDWIDSYSPPIQETIDSTKGKLALLDADKLDGWTAAIEGISDAKEKMAAKLKFDAPTWSRSDPLWNKLGKAAKQSAKAVDDIWRAAVA